MSDEVPSDDPDDCEDDARNGMRRRSLDSVRRQHIARVLYATDHNLYATADILGLTVSELSVMMQRLEIP